RVGTLVAAEFRGLVSERGDVSRRELATFLTGAGSRHPAQLCGWRDADGLVAGRDRRLDVGNAGDAGSLQYCPAPARAVGPVLQFAARATRWNSIILLSFPNQYDLVLQC